jgi:hypothetical protein
MRQSFRLPHISVTASPIRLKFHFNIQHPPYFPLVQTHAVQQPKVKVKTISRICVKVFAYHLSRSPLHQFPSNFISTFNTIHIFFPCTPMPHKIPRSRSKHLAAFASKFLRQSFRLPLLSVTASPICLKLHFNIQHPPYFLLVPTHATQKPKVKVKTLFLNI